MRLRHNGRSQTTPEPPLDGSATTRSLAASGHDEADHFADRWLRILASPIRVFATIIFGFSVIGGTLQEVTRRNLGDDAPRAITERVTGNLIVSVTALAVVVWWVRSRRNSRISLQLGFIAGIVGGVVRLPVEYLIWGERRVSTLAVSVLTEGLWLLMAALLTSLIAGFAARILAEGQRLTSALASERQTRALMLQADQRLRQEISEWLHGHLQAELIVAAADARLLGPEGDPIVRRLDAVRTADVRRLAHALHPSLIAVDLEASLNEVVSLKDTEGRVRLVYRDETIHDALSPTVTGDVAIAIHRIAEEALNNALRHGTGSTISIAVRVRSSSVDMTVTNSMACQQLEVTPGLGLRIIDSWVRSLDGEWELVAEASTMTLNVHLPSTRPNVTGAGSPTTSARLSRPDRTDDAPAHPPRSTSSPTDLHY